MNGDYRIYIMAARADLLYVAAVCRAVEAIGARVVQFVREADTYDPCVRLSVAYKGAKSLLIKALMPMARTYPIMLGIRREDTPVGRIGLVAFDLDSTLVRTEIMNELATAHGCLDEMGELTEAAMSGREEFPDNFSRRVSMLRGLPLAKLEELSASLPIVEGLPSLMQKFKEQGIRSAIISGGFRLYSHNIKERYGFDYICTSEAEVENGLLTGRLSGTIVDAKVKAEFLRSLAKELSLTPAEIVAVGDGANDVPMLDFSAGSIIFNSSAHPPSMPQLRIEAILQIMGCR
ncbi:phosphoserine phosphatase SerB [Porphyromonas gingivalis]|nr:phosphoserine phosphatase SerB [Porphyromonas gingivalis]